MTDFAPLEVIGVRKAYRRRPVLRDISFALGAGEAVATIGPNGSGKSTLLGCITGDRLPDAGTIRLCGADPFSDHRAAARCMGFVPEQPFLYGELTVDEMLTFVAEARELPAGMATAERARLLDLLGLQGAENLLCRELSQGMGRKVAIIAALLHRPPLLVLDEAMNGLDRSSTEQLVRELDERRRAGTAILISSHDLAFLGDWCDWGIALGPGAQAELLRGERWETWRRRPSLALGK